MRKRSIGMLLRFTPDEFERLTQKAQEAKLPREVFCRLILNGAEVKAAPPADYYKLIMEVRRVGTNINQILQKANAIGLLDVPMIRRALEDNHATEKMLWLTFRNGCDH